jgi:hypothetical protein
VFREAKVPHRTECIGKCTSTLGRQGASRKGRGSRGLNPALFCELRLIPGLPLGATLEAQGRAERLECFGKARKTRASVGQDARGMHRRCRSRRSGTEDAGGVRVNFIGDESRRPSAMGIARVNCTKGESPAGAGPSMRAACESASGAWPSAPCDWRSNNVASRKERKTSALEMHKHTERQGASRKGPR